MKIFMRETKTPTQRAMSLRVLWIQRQYLSLTPSNPTSLISWLYWRIYKPHIRTQSSSPHCFPPLSKIHTFPAHGLGSFLQKRHMFASMRSRSSTSYIKNKQDGSSAWRNSPNFLPWVKIRCVGLKVLSRKVTSHYCGIDEGRCDGVAFWVCVCM